MLLLALACSTTCLDGAIAKDGVCPGASTDDSSPIIDTDIPTACSIVALTAEPLGEAVNSVRVHADLDVAAPVELDCDLVSGPPTTETILPANAVWSYQDAATIDAAWADVAYDDSAWASGAAPLGYGELVSTTISYGASASNKHISAWFRVHFVITDPKALANPTLHLTYDDGVDVFLNGIELGRWNLPDGELSNTTLATDAVEPTTTTIPIPASSLVPGDNVLAVELHQVAANSSDAWLSATLTTDGPRLVDLDEHFHVAAGQGNPVDLDLHGLLAGSDYQCVATTPCGSPATIDVTTPPLPEGLPELSPEGTPPAPGYTLFNSQRTCIGDYTMYLIIVDPEGRIRWYHTNTEVASDGTMDIESRLLDDDTILWAGGDDPDAAPQRVDLAGDTVWRTHYEGADDDVYHHDVVLTPTGTIAGLVESPVTLRNGSTVAGPGIVEQDPTTNTVVWRWDAQSAYDAGDLSTDGSGSGDPWHANALTAVEDVDGPAFYMNMFSSNEVVRIDRTTGALTWTLGSGGDFTLLDSTGAAALETDWFHAAHALHSVDATHFTLYDNGNATNGSRVLEYEIDVAAKTARLVGQWGEGWYNPTWGDGDLLADGTVLVDESATWCNGGTGGPGGFLLADFATREVLWRLRFGTENESSYRAQWIPGCDLFGNGKYCPD